MKSGNEIVYSISDLPYNVVRLSVLLRGVWSAPEAEVQAPGWIDGKVGGKLVPMQEPRIMAPPALCGDVVEQVLPDLRLV